MPVAPNRVVPLGGGAPDFLSRKVDTVKPKVTKTPAAKAPKAKAPLVKAPAQPDQEGKVSVVDELNKPGE